LDEKSMPRFTWVRLIHLFRVPSLSLHLASVVIRTRRGYLECAWSFVPMKLEETLGRTTRRRDATAELSHGGASVPWMGSACNTYACSHAHDRNRRRFGAILLHGHWEREETNEARGDSCANGPLRVANGTLGSLGRESGAGKKGS